MEGVNIFLHIINYGIESLVSQTKRFPILDCLLNSFSHLI